MNRIPPVDRDRLLHSATFRPLDPDLLDAVLAETTALQVPAAETLFRAGQAHRESLFIIAAGRLELQDPAGDHAVFETGSILGLPNYLDDEPHASTATALEASTVLALTFPAVRRLERELPPFASMLNGAIARRIRVRGRGQGPAVGALTRPVRDAMHGPVACCAGSTTLRDAFQRMRSGKMGSLGVTGEDGALLGLVTVPDLAEALLMRGAAPEDPLCVAAKPAPQVSPSLPLWQADDLQLRRGTKYLLVTEGPEPVGVLSQTDILRAVVSQHATLLTRVEQAERLSELTALGSEVPRVAREVWQSSRQATQAARVLSDIHLSIQRRCIQLVQAEFEGRAGPAPLDFALFVVGSGGRREMLLRPDQDNGIVLSDPPGGVAPDEAARQWFAGFTQRVNTALDQVGYALCRGDIMARSQRWSDTLGRWRERIDNVAAQATAPAARWANIAFDFDWLHGDERLLQDLRRHLLAVLDREDRLLRAMQRDDADGEPAIGWFNRLLMADDEGRRGRVDLKRNGLRLIVDGARIYALGAGIAATHTGDRLAALVRQGVLSADFADSVAAANEQLTDLLLEHQLRQVEAGKEPDALVEVQRLEPIGRESLRMAMRAVRRFQDRLQHDYR